MRRVRLLIVLRTALAGALLATTLSAAGAAAATYTVNVGNALDLGSVATAASGDTVFRINPATGGVSVQSGSGRRIGTASVRSLVTVTCKPARAGETKCDDDKLSVRVSTIGSVLGRARALTNFAVAMGTATLANTPSGTSPLSFQISPPGANLPKTFYVAADFSVAGDDSGLVSGAGENNFLVQVVDAVGLPLASDSDKGRVTALRALAVAKTADLSFGRIQVPTSGTSTVNLDAATGARTASGNAVAYATPAPTRAAFNITGEGGQQVSLFVPATFNLTGPSTIPVTVTSTAPSSLSLSGALGAAGAYSFTIGGSFSISPTTPTGAYSGVLSVSIDYN